MNITFLSIWVTISNFEIYLKVKKVTIELIWIIGLFKCPTSVIKVKVRVSIAYIHRFSGENENC